MNAQPDTTRRQGSLLDWLPLLPFIGGLVMFASNPYPTELMLLGVFTMGLGLLRPILSSSWIYPVYGAGVAVMVAGFLSQQSASGLGTLIGVPVVFGWLLYKLRQRALGGRA